MIAGGSVDTFWNETLRTVQAVLSAARDRDREDWRMRVSQAWLGAGLARTEKLPDLDTLIDETPQRRGQSDEEMAHNLALWSAALEHQYGKEG